MTPQVWHQVGIDLLGPLTATAKNNQYILTMTDYFSKWAEAAPLLDKSTNGVAEMIFNVFCRLGCAAIHISDQGKEFCSEVMERLYQITGM